MTHGHEHPNVLAIEKEIEVTERLLMEEQRSEGERAAN